MSSSIDMEILAVAVITILAVISPGPDFAMITRVSLSRGRRAGVLCAIGIGTGISVHLAYTLIGLGVVFANNVWVLSTIRYLGALYLIWLGLGSMFPGLNARMFGLVGRRPKASSSNGEDLSTIGQTEQTRNPASAFAIGFACNALNPKAMLFIVSLFSQVISPKTALPMEIGYGVFIAMTHMLWFSLVAVALTLPAVQARIQAIKKWIERGVGLCLTGLGIRLLAS